MAGFAHLHVHSDYSLADGSCKLDDLCRAVAEDGGTAVAVTDHGVLHAAIEFQAIARRHRINPIVGVEAYLNTEGLQTPTDDPSHLTLLAANDAGFRNLTKLVSAGWTDGFHADKPQIDFETLSRFSDGVVCLSGCENGPVARALLDDDNEAAEDVSKRLATIFGARFYLEMMRHGLAEDAMLERGIRRLSTALRVPIIATNDTHYLHEHDHSAHELRMCASAKMTLTDPRRPQLATNNYHLKTQDEMRLLFADMPEACDLTVQLGEQIALSPPARVFHLPQFPVPQIPQRPERSPADYLRSLATNGMKKRYGDVVTTDPKFKERLTSELTMIETMGFSPYFLVVWDIVRYARSQEIPVGPGRGSAVGSMVSYCLGITEIDPIENGLLFERFLNPNRVSMPDIDIDFASNRRGEINEYIREKYGSDSVAQIVTFDRMKARSAIDAAGRVLEMPLPDIARLKDLIRDNEVSLRALRVQSDVVTLTRERPKLRVLLDAASSLEGLVSGYSTHAAGVVITPGSITDFAPLMRTKEGGLAVQYGSNVIDDIGLLKIDVLGLANLTAMQIAAQQIRAMSDAEFRLTDIPRNDPATFDIFARGETVGIFQFGSDGMKSLLRRLEPKTHEDLTAAVALYRPGSLGALEDYFTARVSTAPQVYLDPKLESILAPTHGIPLFQEQIMEISRAIGGFSLAEADELRKVISKKQMTKIPIYREKFIAGAAVQGIETTRAEAIFAFIEPFGEYGFNKSHAAAYAWQAYRNAYLKAHYPAPYLAATIIAQQEQKRDAGDLKKYLDEAKRLGLPILPPSVNLSQEQFTGSRDGIRFGLASVRDISDATAHSLVKERFSNGPFSSIEELADRIPNANKRMLEALAKSGAFDDFGYARAQLLGQIEPVLARGRKRSPLPFDADLIAPISFTAADRLRAEREMLGVYLSGHPAEAAIAGVIAKGGIRISGIDGHTIGQTVTVSGVIADVRKMQTKKRETMAILSIDDGEGEVGVTLFPRSFEAFKDVARPNELVVVRGKVEHSYGAAGRFSIIAEKIWKWTPPSNAIDMTVAPTHLAPEVAVAPRPFARRAISDPTMGLR